MNIGTAENPNYVANDVIVAGNQLYGYNNPRRYHEASIHDGTYVKLREMSFGYKIPERLSQKLKIKVPNSRLLVETLPYYLKTRHTSTLR